MESLTGLISMGAIVFAVLGVVVIGTLATYFVMKRRYAMVGD